MTRAPYLSSRLQGFGTTVFAEMSALAVATVAGGTVMSRSSLSTVRFVPGVTTPTLVPQTGEVMVILSFR